MPQWWLFSRKFSVARKTNQLKIPYYVKENFHSEYQGSVGRLEASVEEEYLNNLKHSCYRERNYSKCAILLLKFVCYICSSVLQMIILLVRIAFRHFYTCFFFFFQFPFIRAEETMLMKARNFGDRDLYYKAQHINTPSCDKLHSLHNN